MTDMKEVATSVCKVVNRVGARMKTNHLNTKFAQLCVIFLVLLVGCQRWNTRIWTGLPTPQPPDKWLRRQMEA